MIDLFDLHTLKKAEFELAVTKLVEDFETNNARPRHPASAAAR